MSVHFHHICNPRPLCSLAADSGCEGGFNTFSAAKDHATPIVAEQIPFRREDLHSLRLFYHALYCINTTTHDYYTIFQDHESRLPRTGNYETNFVTYINNYIHEDDRDLLLALCQIDILRELCQDQVISKYFRQKNADRQQWLEMDVRLVAEQDLILIAFRQTHYPGCADNALDSNVETLHSLQKANEQLKTALSAALLNEKRFRISSSHIVDMLISYDFKQQQYEILQLNDIEASQSERLPFSVERWETLIHPEDVLTDRTQRQITLEKGESGSMEIRFRGFRESDIYHWYRITVSPIFDESGELAQALLAMEDIEVQRQEVDMIRKKAELDLLSGLLNNATMKEKCSTLLRAYPDESCAMLVLDLDNFKRINDNYGHLAGDALIADMARILKKTFRSEDLLARAGGDEFVVLMRGNCDEAIVMAKFNEIQSRLQTMCGERPFQVTTSAGMAFATPGVERSYNSLFQKADTALYYAKAHDKGKCYAYLPEMAQQIDISQLSRSNSDIESHYEVASLSRNLNEYILETLMNSTDVLSDIDAILAAIGKQMGVSRAYIFEDSADRQYCCNTFEWCNEGISPEIENLRALPHAELDNLYSLFDENGIFYCEDVSLLSESHRKILEPQGIRSILLCGIRDKGQFCGYIGFDECTRNYSWTAREVSLISFAASIIGVYLLKERAEQNQNCDLK